VAVRVNILTTYNGAGQKKALRDLALMQKQATLAGNGVAAGMFKASAAMQRVGASMAKTGAFMTRNITLPVAAIGAVSVVMAARFDSAMKLIQTQAGGSANDVKVLSAAVLELGAKGQHGPNELAAALYHLKSVGMGNATAMKALTQAERLASVGHADLEATTNAVAGAYKSGIKGAQDFGVTVGTLNAIIGAGNLRMDDLNSALGTGFLVTAQTFGVSLTSVGAALAMMTSRGIPATRAAMALKMAFAGMAAPSDKAAKIMDKLHLNSKKLAETMRSGGMLPALTMLKEKLAGLTKTEQSIALTKMFGAKSSQAILTLLGNLKDYDRTLKQVKDNTGKFNELAKAQAEDATAKWDHFKSSMGSAAILIGNQLLPTAISLADRLGAVGAWLNKLSPSTRKWVVQIALVAAAAGPVLLIVGKLTIGVGRMIGVVGSLSLAFGKGGDAAPKWARGIAAVTKGLASFVIANPVVLVIAAIVAAIVILYMKCEWFRKAVQKVVRAVVAAFKWLANAIGAIFRWIGDHWRGLLDAFLLAAGPIGWIVRYIIKHWSQVAEIGRKVWDAVKAAALRFWGWAGPYITAAVKVWWTQIKTTFATIVALGKWLWDKLQVAVAWFWSWSDGFITGSLKAWWTIISTTFKLIVAVVQTTWTAVSAAVKKFWKWAGPFIKTAVKLWWSNIKTTFAAIRTVTVAAWNAIKAVVQVNIRAVTAVIHTIQAVVGFVRGVWGAIRSATSAAWSAIVGTIRRLWSGVIGWFSGTASKFASVGSAIVNGIRSGLSSAWGSFKSWFIGMIGSPIQWAKDVLHIGSPSRVFAEIGYQTAQGLALGMANGNDMVRKAAQVLAGATLPDFGAMGGFRVAEAPAGRASVARAAAVLPGAQQGSGDYYDFRGALFAQDFDTVIAKANARGTARIDRQDKRARGRS
jgi:TP901 family phage tail tape measure protein